MYMLTFVYDKCIMNIFKYKLKSNKKMVNIFKFDDIEMEIADFNIPFILSELYDDDTN